MPCSVAWWCAWLIRAWCRAAQNGTQWDSAGLPWTGTRNLQRADLGDSVRTDTGRTEFRFHAAGMVSVQVSRYSDGLGSAVCKTVGLAYVGSNPTPATNHSPQYQQVSTVIRNFVPARLGQPERAVCKPLAPAGQLSARRVLARLSGPYPLTGVAFVYTALTCEKILPDRNRQHVRTDWRRSPQVYDYEFD